MLLYSWSFCDPQTLKYFGLKKFLSWEFAPCSAPSKRIPSSPPCKRNFIFYIWCQQYLNLSPPCIKRNFIFYIWCQKYLNLWSEITLEAMSCSSYFSWTCRYFPQTRRRSCVEKVKGNLDSDHFVFRFKMNLNALIRSSNSVWSCPCLIWSATWLTMMMMVVMMIVTDDDDDDGCDDSDGWWWWWSWL